MTYKKGYTISNTRFGAHFYGPDGKVTKTIYMKEEKYYTPTIEEFHIGFEYEEKSSGLWITQTYSGLSPRMARVKHLDREDIESLGWEYYSYYRDGGTSIFKKDKYELVFKGSNRITPSLNVVIATDDSRTGRIFFDGELKNKSELKRTLKQIGV